MDKNVHGAWLKFVFLIVAKNLAWVKNCGGF